MSIVKICGLRNQADALLAALAGADMLGFIFAPVRRGVAPEIAREAICEVKTLGLAKTPKYVGVFVNDDLKRIRQIASFAGLDLVQLSGDESPTFAASVGLPAVKALHLNGTAEPDAVQRAATDFVEGVPGITLLVDTLVPGQYGGAGVVGDWDTATSLACRFPVILAGGLTPENVAEAIRTVRPLGVDVSSGVETGGRKDGGKIWAFIQAAKSEGGRSDGTG